jgi:hypothetical protein
MTWTDTFPLASSIPSNARHLAALQFPAVDWQLSMIRAFVPFVKQNAWYDLCVAINATADQQSINLLQVLLLLLLLKSITIIHNQLIENPFLSSLLTFIFFFQKDKKDCSFTFFGSIQPKSTSQLRTEITVIIN